MDVLLTICKDNLISPRPYGGLPAVQVAVSIPLMDGAPTVQIDWLDNEV
jgi:hypothetical protein